MDVRLCIIGSSMHLSDHELLRVFRRAPSAQTFEPIVDRYLSFVFAAAQRQLMDEADASEATLAVFQALARRSRHFPRKGSLVDWLFQAARAASMRKQRAPKALQEPRSTSGSSAPGLRNGDTWARISPVLDDSLARLSPKDRIPVLLGVLLNWERAGMAQALRVRARRVEARVNKGFAKLGRRMHKDRLLIDEAVLRPVLLSNGCAAVLPPNLKADILASAEHCARRRPKLPLARSTLRALIWVRRKRLLKIAGVTLGVIAIFTGAAALSLWMLWRNGSLLPWLIEFGARQQLRETPELAAPAKPWPPEPALAAKGPVRTAADLYQATHIWTAHLRFSADQWAAMVPNRVPPVANLIAPDGTITLRNPKAQRSGVAGALGFDYNWTRAGLEFADLTFTNVAIRFRGNGTYINSLHGCKQPFKVDLNKFVKGQQLAGVDTLDFLNLVEDRSFMHDALGYELFRAANVPAPRTAYLWLTLTVQGQADHKPLGLYALVENIDSDFAESQFGSKKTPIFKPVTPDLFQYRGENWAAYADIYDLKTKATEEQKRRVIDFSLLLTRGDETEFARRVGEFLDLDEFSRFLAALVLVANYDSFLTYGQNYYLYLDPESSKFGFIPWDLDQAWGSFPQFGTAAAREHASIWQPWAMRNRLLERLMRVEDFRTRYRASLEALLSNAFTPERLFERIDELGAVIRGPIAAESDFRLRLFDQAISTNWLAGPRDGGEGPKRPVHQLKRFIINRAKSVRDQLDGRSKGIVVESSTNWGG